MLEDVSVLAMLPLSGDTYGVGVVVDKKGKEN